jgi:hypothetical protein
MSFNGMRTPPPMSGRSSHRCPDALARPTKFARAASAIAKQQAAVLEALFSEVRVRVRVANGCPWTATTCCVAARGGHLTMLQWARANGCPWNWLTCSGAAAFGHLAVLQWARANDCPWDESVCNDAAEGGHLAVLQWARANGCPWSAATCSRATQGGHLAVLQWARANGWSPGSAAVGSREWLPVGLESD